MSPVFSSDPDGELSSFDTLLDEDVIIGDVIDSFLELLGIGDTLGREGAASSIWFDDEGKGDETRD